MKIDLDTVLTKTNRYYAQEKGRDTEDCKPVPSEQIRALAKALVEEFNLILAEASKPVTIIDVPASHWVELKPGTMTLYKTEP